MLVITETIKRKADIDRATGAIHLPPQHIRVSSGNRTRSLLSVAANLAALIVLLVGYSEPALADQGVESLLSQSSCNTGDSVCEDIIVRQSPKGYIQSISGVDFAIDLAVIGCSFPSNEENVRCLLEQFGDVFGFSEDKVTLVLRDTTTLLSGATVVLFDQVAAGLRVHGAALSVVVMPPASVVAITSNVNHPLAVPDRETVGTALRGLSETVAEQTAALAAGLDKVELVPDGEYLYVDPKTDIGRPALAFRVYEPGGTLAHARVLLDAATGALLHRQDTRNFAWPRHKYYGSMKHYRVTPSTDCPTSACPTGYGCQRYIPGPPPCDPGPPVTCGRGAYQDYLRPSGEGTCVQLCAANRPCPSGWQCQMNTTVDSTNTEGYCIDNPGDGGTNFVLMYDTDVLSNDHWYDGEFHKWNVMHQHIVNNLNEVVSWHQTDLGVTSTMFPYNYRLNALAACDCGGDTCSENEGCGSANQCSYGGEEGICLRNIHNDFVTNYNDNMPYLGPNTMGTVAHEFTHVLLWAYYAGLSPEADTGLREGLPEMFARLFTEYRFSANLWGDEPVLLDPLTGEPEASFRYPLPYPLRSRFDWFSTDPDDTHVGGFCYDSSDCSPYHWCKNSTCTTDNNSSQNREMWWRFLRLLSMGKAAFPNEDLLSMQFTGIGVDQTQQIVHDAAYLYRDTVPNGTLLEWTDKLVTAANAYGHAGAVRYALGLVGFFPYDYTAWNGAILTNRSPMETVFSTYAYSTNKQFAAYRSSADGTIHVRYYVGTTATESTLTGSSTNDRPAIVEYNANLYVFWRNASDNSIQYYYLSQNYSTPLWFGPYSLGTQGIISNGAFTAASFNGKLTLVFVHPTDERMKIATCSSQYRCQTAQFDAYGAPKFKDISGLTFDVRAGVSATVGTHVHGDSYSSSSDVLFVAFAKKDTAQIGVLRLDASYSMLGTPAWMNSVYPYAYRTYQAMGLRVRKSAFAANGNYLYLTFVKDDGVSVFTSVLQDFSAGTRCFTRPVDTFRDVTSGAGVSWIMGSSYDTGDVYYVSLTQNGIGRRLVGYGKY